MQKTLEGQLEAYQCQEKLLFPMGFGKPRMKTDAAGATGGVTHP